MKLGLLVWKTSPNCKATVWTTKQGSSTAHTFLPGMYLVSHIFHFGLWPMQGIRSRHGHFDLSHKNAKTSWNTFELGFAVRKFVTLKRKTGVGDFPDPAATFRDWKATLRDQCFLCIISQLRIGTWISLGKTQTLLGWLGKTKKCVGIVRTSKETCWDNYRLNLSYLNQKMWWDSLGKPRHLWKCI